MLTVHKYPLRLDDVVGLELREGAEILDIQDQDGSLYLWALVDPGKKLVLRRFRIAGTGHPIDKTEFKSLEHLATVQQFDGRLVWHIFEVT